MGFRPGTPDNAPVIGPGTLRGLTWATGHHRNGILLAPLTAELVVASLRGHEPASMPDALATYLRSREVRFEIFSPTERPHSLFIMIYLNGNPHEDGAGRTVASVLLLLDLPRDARGVAVAVEGEVVPRAGWGRSRSPTGRTWRCLPRCREDDRSMGDPTPPLFLERTD